MRLALYQPDIAQNTGTILRMAACLGLGVDLIGPAGFDASDRNLRRAGLDYLEHVEIVRHVDFARFNSARKADGRRLVLLSTGALDCYTDMAFTARDTLLLGRESAGVPDHVHGAADLRVLIPLAPHMRSLNIAIAAAMVTGEALRQTRGFPTPSDV